MLERFSLMA